MPAMPLFPAAAPACHDVCKRSSGNTHTSTWVHVQRREHSLEFGNVWSGGRTVTRSSKPEGEHVGQKSSLTEAPTPPLRLNIFLLFPSESSGLFRRRLPVEKSLPPRPPSPLGQGKGSGERGVGMWIRGKRDQWDRGGECAGRSKEGESKGCLHGCILLSR
eukprot:1993430-Rhodomonas_salina.4